MAYLDLAAGHPFAVARDRAEASPVAADLGALEWSVVDIARHDRISSLYRPGPIARLLRWTFGVETTNGLADPRLESLRRMSVLGWHRGYAVSPDEVDAFVGAGFTLEQYETLMTRISTGRSVGRRRRRPH